MRSDGVSNKIFGIGYLKKKLDGIVVIEIYSFLFVLKSVNSLLNFSFVLFDVCLWMKLKIWFNKNSSVLVQLFFNR